MALSTGPTRLEDVRFVIDENLLRMAEAVVALRRDTACFGRSLLDELLPSGVLDPNWIPEVAGRGWIVITNDKRLRTRPGEADLAVRYGLRVVHLFGTGNLTSWQQLSRLLLHWPRVESHADANPRGPWWLSLRPREVRVMRFEPGAVER